MFSRIDICRISGLTEKQIRRLDETQILLPKLHGMGVDAEYSYNELIFVCVYGIIRERLKELGFGLHELNDKFKGGLASEIDFVNSDVFFFTRASFFLIPSSPEVRVIYEEWIGNKTYDIFPNVTTNHLRAFGLNVSDGILLNALVLNLDKVRTHIKQQADKLGISDKVPFKLYPKRAMVRCYKIYTGKRISVEKQKV
ncbi:hypothetical protein [Cyanobacterium aponinum]|uniref:hypothetical protein n=1 Tax=Cyanobacterium aponinum TaxID=379064 RepID=UPI000C12ABF3|nr:hypothetical protein [Cyanobacterium aponinum]PHV61309.1 hypothetical protein CSQ80_16330 [Cyanobacterium aponinum IPPAS B-1201]